MKSKLLVFLFIILNSFFMVYSEIQVITEDVPNLGIRSVYYDLGDIDKSLITATSNNLIETGHIDYFYNPYLYSKSANWISEQKCVLSLDSNSGILANWRLSQSPYNQQTSNDFYINFLKDYGTSTNPNLGEDILKANYYMRANASYHLIIYNYTGEWIANSLSQYHEKNGIVYNVYSEEILITPEGFPVSNLIYTKKEVNN